VGGYKTTPVSFLAQSLLDLQLPNFSTDSDKSCTNCSIKGTNGKPIRVTNKEVTTNSVVDSTGTLKTAVAFCGECKQKLCAKCSTIHKKIKITAEHQLMTIDDSKR